MPRETWHAAKVIALAASTPIAVVSGLSAAVMHDLPILASRMPSHVHVTRSTKSMKNNWVVTHQSTLRDDEVVRVVGVRCTSILRTLYDLAEVLNPQELLAAADAARARGIDLTPLNSAVRHGRVLRWVVEHATDRSESYAESLSRFHLIASGRELPMLQPSVISAEGRFLGRADFGTTSGLLGECDGKLKYSRYLKPGQSAADAVMDEKRRENDFRDTNCEVFRWEWIVLSQPRVFVERWDRALLRAEALPPTTASFEIRAMRRPELIDWTKALRWDPDAIR